MFRFHQDATIQHFKMNLLPFQLLWMGVSYFKWNKPTEAMIKKEDLITFQLRYINSIPFSLRFHFIFIFKWFPIKKSTAEKSLFIKPVWPINNFMEQRNNGKKTLFEQIKLLKICYCFLLLSAIQVEVVCFKVFLGYFDLLWITFLGFAWIYIICTIKL